MNVKIIVATHKKYWMPSEKMYIPVHVGAQNKEDIGYVRDDSGDNISVKNPNYCELTGLYWAWKNLCDAEYVGLVHYRRHFSMKKVVSNKKSAVLSYDQASSLLNSSDVILPSPRNYYIETNYNQYIHAHHAADLKITREVLEEFYPTYMPFYDKYMQSSKGHRFNMFIMKRELFDAYCEWLFDVLLHIESRLDISKYDKYNARVFGFISERLLDIWLMRNKISYMEVPCIFLEKQNWVLKGFRFVKRKVVGTIRN